MVIYKLIQLDIGKSNLNKLNPILELVKEGTITNKKISTIIKNIKFFKRKRFNNNGVKKILNKKFVNSLDDNQI